MSMTAGGPRSRVAFGGMPLSRRNTWKAALSVPLPGLGQCKRACSRIRTSEPGYAISQRLQVPICSFEVPPPPPPSRKTGSSCMNDRFYSDKCGLYATRIAITCRVRKWGVDDGPDSGLKSVVRATIPKYQGGFTPKQDRNPGHRHRISGVRIRGYSPGCA